MARIYVVRMQSTGLMFLLYCVLYCNKSVWSAAVNFVVLCRNVYWTDVAQSAIFVARSDGNYEKTIIIEPDVRPSAIVVDPELG